MLEISSTSQRVCLLKRPYSKHVQNMHYSYTAIACVTAISKIIYSFEYRLERRERFFISKGCHFRGISSVCMYQTLRGPSISEGQ